MPLTPATLLLTAAAMLAFAANSLLCRMALADASVDPATFGAVRLLAGALVLAAIARARSLPRARPDGFAAAMLFGYVAGFSYAYVTLPTGTGALILFGAVQLTMIGAGLRAGERFRATGWLGLALAIAGLAALLAPGVSAPPLAGALLMAGAGVAWGLYSLRGRGAGEPVAATTGNFVRAAPMALALWLAVALAAPAGTVHASPRGLALAVASGALTSGLGYVIWYAALPALNALRAATVQLSVPPLAALAGVLVLGEALTLRLALALATILGGIALVLVNRSRTAAR
jgi:drug/metabolite transporter (DMT)-like permease